MNIGQWQLAIINGLSSADPSVKPLLSLRVPYFAQENLQLYACTWQLGYLYTMRDAIQLLMGGIRQQIDTSIREHRGRSDGFNTSRGDTQKQTQSNSVVVRFSNALGASRYKDKTDGFSTASSSRTRVSGAFRDDKFRYDDRGIGGSRRVGLTRIRAHSHRNSYTNYDRLAEGKTVYTFPYNEQGYNFVQKVGVNLGVASSQTDTYSGVTTGGMIGGMRHVGDAFTGVGRGKVLGESDSERTNDDLSTSFFRSNIISHSEGTGGSNLNDDGSSTSHSESFGSGAGDTSDTSRGEQGSAYQSKMQMAASTEAHRGNAGETFTETHFDKFNQRFENLNDMLAEINEQIVAMKARVSASNVGYRVGLLTATIPLPCWCTDSSHSRWRGLPCQTC